MSEVNTNVTNSIITENKVPGFWQSLKATVASVPYATSAIACTVVGASNAVMSATALSNGFFQRQLEEQANLHSARVYGNTILSRNELANELKASGATPEEIAKMQSLVKGV